MSSNMELPLGLPLEVVYHNVLPYVRDPKTYIRICKAYNLGMPLQKEVGKCMEYTYYNLNGYHIPHGYAKVYDENGVIKKKTKYVYGDMVWSVTNNQGMCSYHKYTNGMCTSIINKKVY
ncbi:Hypothetical protein ORPV_508 [Orpheovirus IHUMI-LCC2]|uniref:Uncharacterized protein n=1 Tax=Orpheovirus IHUMI-LCC2 TaxID=2023057 RepID=A0A2I2L4D8_9VIRU|nr:Hypothetical protein ORPV_508 [Orpheovirus IHUMI-LCC2]SNW62412.1 Hypothetical protein ORPV_508 [Orpheovirus IHUMI-LCC2]